MTTQSKYAWPDKQYDGNVLGYEEHATDQQTWLIEKGYDEFMTEVRCSQKPIARKIHVQVACDQMRMFSGTKFVWHPSKYMQKDVTKRDWYRTKAFHLYEPFLSLLGCSACTMDGPYAQQNLRGCSLPSRVH